MGTQSPCLEWAEQLVLRQDDLAPSERAALDAHLATCPACAHARSDYWRLVSRLQALPSPTVRPLPRLLPELLYNAEDYPTPGHMEYGRNGGAPLRLPLPSDNAGALCGGAMCGRADMYGRPLQVPYTGSCMRAPYAQIISVLYSLVAVLAVGLLLSGYIWLLGSVHRSNAGILAQPVSAQLLATPDVLDFGMLDEGKTKTLGFDIKNTGSGTLDWQASVDPGSVPWLKVSQRAGRLTPGSATHVTATVDGTALVNRGMLQYIAFVQVSSNGGYANVVAVASVPPRCLTASAVSFFFQGVTGDADPPTQVVKITSCGAVGPWMVETRTDDSKNWLSVSPASGYLARGASVTLTIKVTLAGLDSRTYEGHIFFGIGTNAGEEGSVTLNVR
ncbi:MAG: zf-HC2 domain-containing protein [Chloroflexota bacterium]|nr:zf-HC2 domain-containing protein [Chloroflexota bacterium]